MRLVLLDMFSKTKVLWTSTEVRSRCPVSSDTVSDKYLFSLFSLSLCDLCHSKVGWVFERKCIRVAGQEYFICVASILYAFHPRPTRAFVMNSSASTRPFGDLTFRLRALILYEKDSVWCSPQNAKYCAYHARWPSKIAKHCASHAKRSFWTTDRFFWTTDRLVCLRISLL